MKPTHVSLVDLLVDRASSTPAAPVYTYLGERGAPDTSMTTAELHRAAQAIAVALRERTRPGDRALMLYGPGIEFIAAFFGCMYAGVIAVPVFPPLRPREQKRVLAIARAAAPSVVLTSAAVRSQLGEMAQAAPGFASIPWLATDEVDLGHADHWRPERVSGETLAFLQFTSGSTGTPKGVMVSHGNLLHNEYMIARGFEHDSSSTIVGWLPHFHDMGLIGSILQPLYIGAHAVLMSPASFVRDPMRWLRTISATRAHTSGGPNFGYELCLRRQPRSAELDLDLDLSSWSLAFVGAEPIRPETLRRFAEAYEPYGFRSSSFYPCYGLAEATLIVSGAKKGGGARLVQGPAGRELVASGEVLLPDEQTVRIVDPATGLVRDPGQEGEIWVSGPSVALGYWKQPEESQKTFGAQLPADGARTFLRTGDLGRLQPEGLVVTGRIKDLLIIRGANHYPQDIELTVERAHEGMRPGAVAAFAVASNGEERLAIVAEVNRQKVQDGLLAVCDAIREAVAEEHDLRAHAIVLIAQNTIHKTSSGKIQRQSSARALLKRELEIVEESVLGPVDGRVPAAAVADVAPDATPTPDRGEELRREVVRVLGIEAGSLRSDQPLARLGLDSIGAVTLAFELEQRWGIELSVPEVLRLDVQGLLGLTRAAAPRNAQPVPAGSPEGVGPLSPGQRALWFLDAAGAGAAYHVATAFQASGALDERRLAQALGALSAAHPALRTTFELQGSEPVQRVHRALPPEVKREDASDWSDERVTAAIDALSQARFDLARGPLLRALVLSRPGGDVLVCAAHHIVCDFWSFSLLLRELAALYVGPASPQEPRSAERLLAHARERAAYAGTEQGKASLAYFKDKLAGELPVIALPIDLPRPTRQRYRGENLRFRVPAGVTQLLLSRAREAGTTPFCVLLAAYAAFLHGHTGQDDLIIGAPSAGRSRAEDAALCGYLVNPLPLRASLAGDPTFSDLVLQVTHEVQGALKHQDLPFPNLVEHLVSGRDAGRSPIFQTWFAFQRDQQGAEALAAVAAGAAGAQLRLGDLSLTSLPVERGASQFELALFAAELGGELACTFEYDSDLFTAERVRRLAERFVSLLTQLANSSNARLSQLDLITPSERKYLLQTWNATEASYPLTQQLHQLFEAQVDRGPGGVAVVHGSQQLSYAQLEERSNQLAHYLIDLGVGPGAFVAVHLERSIDLVVALVAVLKAGAAYVPLEPSNPAERIQAMLADAQPAALLTHSGLLEACRGTDTRIVCVDAERAEIALRKRSRPGIARRNERDPVYMIYTSGSTGVPKGAVNTHRGLVNRISWMQDAYRLDATEAVLQKTPYGFDVSAWEFFWPLAAGARIVLLDPGAHLDPAKVAEAVVSQQVTTLHFVPSMLQLFLAEPLARTCTSLRRVIASGEALPLELVRSFPAVLNAELHNLYGPTEASIDVTAFACLPAIDLKSVPIGRPIANTRLYVRDRLGRLVPPGVAGELYIGGVGVALGYHARPALNAEKFVTNPYVANETLFRSGDLVRHDAQGQLEYLGRVDQQVKIRGYRIELGELEARLRSHDAVREAAVIVDGEGLGERCLLAYFVAEGPVDANALRAHLRSSVPEPMLPRDFIQLERLPLSSNGKLDKRKLPRPTRQNERAYEAPRDEAETALCAVWAEVLGLERVGAEDNFFELGGDSIRCIRARAKARALGLDFDVADIFSHQTVRALAPRARPVVVEAELAPFALVPEADRALVPSGVLDAYPLARLQAGMVFHSEFSPASSFYQVVLSFHLEADLEIEGLRRAAAAVIARHEILRTSFDLGTYSEPLQFVHPTASIDIQYTDLLALSTEQQEQELQAWFDRTQYRRFDYAQPPFLRLELHRRAPNRCQLGVSFHDSILDGWSAASLVSELLETYFDAAENTPRPRPSPRVRYRDFVALERAALTGDADRQFFARYLEDAPFARVPRPTRLPEAERTALSRDAIRPIGRELFSKLDALARRLAVPLKSVFLAAHVRLIGMLTSQTDVVTGLVCNGRPEIEDGDAFLGVCLNTVPLRLSLSGGPWESLISDTWRAEQQVWPHRRYPNAQLQRERGDTLVETAFNYVHFHVYERLANRPLRYLGGRFSDPFHYTLTPQVRVNPERTDGEIVVNYNDGEIDIAQGEAAADTYLRVLERMASDSTASYTRSLLSETEQHTIVETWNATERTYTTPATLDGLLNEQLARSPQGIAVRYEGAELSYRELHERANQLAHWLRSQGVKHDAVVGVCMFRRAELVLALLAVLKAGAAYVPLDPEHPAERVRFVLADARVQVVLTESRLRSLLEPCEAKLLALDEPTPEVSAQPTNAPEPTSSPESAAYVIYTSGSTGRPKGVVNEHRGITNRLAWMQEAYRLEPGERVLQKTPFTFDVSVWELFWPLCTGATCVLAAPGGHRDPAYLSALVQSERISTLHFVPSMLAAFLEDPSSSGCASLRRVICSGEALDANLVNGAHTRLPHVELHNLYGPTEAAIDVTSYACERGNKRPNVPIGRPIANTRIYVLDSFGAAVPPWVAGELCIGGIGVARGYLNLPERTSASFVADPFARDAAARMYRTGDLVRYTPEGLIEYLGRNDGQIKLRGHRIELGEIEAALSRHPQVAAAAVVLNQRIPTQKQLVAYVVPHRGEQPTPGELRKHLRQSLPEAMIPAVLVTLDSMPTTTSGKLDRATLVRRELSPASADRTVSPPTSPVEAELVAIFREVLARPDVDPCDNFFELGGDSILGMQVCSRAARRGLKLSPRQLFAAPSVRELAPLARSLQEVVEDQGEVVGAVPLSPIQRWFFEGEPAVPEHWNMAVLLESHGPLDMAALATAFDAVRRHHDTLRTRFARVGGEWTQEIQPHWSYDVLTAIDASAVSDAALAEFIAGHAERSQTSLSLERGELVRATYFDRGQGRCGRLLVVAHHLVTDVRSWQILGEDLEEAYRAARAGVRPVLASKTGSFKKWAESLQLRANTPELREASQALRTRDAGPYLRLAANGRQPGLGRTVRVLRLDAARTQALETHALTTLRARLNEVVLAALGRALHGITGEGRVRVDLELHGREELVPGHSFERTVGCFTARSPVSVPVASTGAAVLRQLKSELRSLPNGGVDYGVARYLAPNDAGFEAGSISDISFDHLGKLGARVPGALLRFVGGPLGALTSPQNRRRTALDVVSSVVAGELWVELDHDPDLLASQGLESLTAALDAAFTELLSIRAGEAEPTVEDFPAARLSATDLASVMSVISAES